jgi:hypothetical protein
MAPHPDGGMFSIKLVHPPHLKYSCFTPDINNDGRPRWMNFSDKGNTRAVAAAIRPGHRALVYVTKPVQKFIWAIEYTGTVQGGQQVAAAIPELCSPELAEWNKVFLPIQFLATIDVDAAPDAKVALRRAGVDFRPNAFSLKYISKMDYQKIFDAIKWQWPAG